MTPSIKTIAADDEQEARAEAVMRDLFGLLIAELDRQFGAPREADEAIDPTPCPQCQKAGEHKAGCERGTEP